MLRGKSGRFQSRANALVSTVAPKLTRLLGNQRCFTLSIVSLSFAGAVDCLQLKPWEISDRLILAGARGAGESGDGQSNSIGFSTSGATTLKQTLNRHDEAAKAKCLRNRPFHPEKGGGDERMPADVHQLTSSSRLWGIEIFDNAIITNVDGRCTAETSVGTSTSHGGEEMGREMEGKELKCFVGNEFLGPHDEAKTKGETTLRYEKRGRQCRVAS